MPGPQHTRSVDGTSISYEVAGTGRPVLLVGGAFNDRHSMAALRDLLVGSHLVVTYDRRGRGDSEPGPELGSDDARRDAELADARAVLAAVDSGPSEEGTSDGWHVVGHSSGAVLGLLLAGDPGDADVARVTAYEPTWIVPGTRPAPPAGYREDVAAALAAGDRDAAVAAFLEHSALVPPFVVDEMRHGPAWPAGLAHTVPADLALHPHDWRVPDLVMPAGTVVVVVAGGNSPDWFHATAREAANRAGGRFVVLPGQDHGVLMAPQPLADLLR